MVENMTEFLYRKCKWLGGGGWVPLGGEQEVSEEGGCWRAREHYTALSPVNQTPDSG